MAICCRFAPRGNVSLVLSAILPTSVNLMALKRLLAVSTTSLSTVAILTLTMLGLSQSVRAQYSPPPLWAYNGIDGPTNNAYSPDGKYFAIAGNGGVQVFNTASKALVGSYLTLTIGVHAVTFTPDDKTVIVGGESYNSSQNGLVEFWDIATGTLKTELSTEASVYSIALSPDGKSLAAGGYDFTFSANSPTVSLWNAKTLTLEGTLSSPAIIVRSIAFSPDSKFLAAGGATSGTGLIELWNVSTKTLASTLPTQSTSVYSIAFSPSGKLLAAGGRGPSGTSLLEVWNVSKAKLSATLPTQGTLVNTAVFSHDGLSLYAGTTDQNTYGGTLEKWNVATSARTSILNAATQETVVGLSISPDGQSLLECGQTLSSRTAVALGVSQIWNLASAQVTSIINADLVHYAPSFAFSPDSKTLISGASNYKPGTLTTEGWLGFWNSTKGTLQSGVPCADGMVSIALSRDGKVLVDAAANDTECILELRDGLTGKLKSTLVSKPNNYILNSVAISPDGSIAAVAGQIYNGGGFLQIWNLATKSLVFDLSSTAFTSVNTVSFSPDGKKLAVGLSTLVGGSKAGYVQVLDPATGKVDQNLYPDQFNIQQLCFSPDGGSLVVCGLQYFQGQNYLSGKSEIWNLSTSTLTTRLPDAPYISYFGPITFSPDGKLIYVSDSSDIRVFDSSTYVSISGLNVGANHGGMAISPDGKLIGYSGVPTIGVQQSPVGSVKLSTLTVTGGTPVKGTVTLLHPAPTYGENVLLATSNVAVATLPASVYVPAGATSASFTIEPTPVAISQSVEISVELGGFSVTSQLLVQAPAIQSLTISPCSLKGGKPAKCTVTLNTPAPAGGISIPLNSSSTAATVPAALVIPQGAKSAVFTVTTTAVKSSVRATISAGTGTGSKSVTLTVQ